MHTRLPKADEAVTDHRPRTRPRMASTYTRLDVPGNRAEALSVLWQPTRRVPEPLRPGKVGVRARISLRGVGRFVLHAGPVPRRTWADRYSTPPATPRPRAPTATTTAASLPAPTMTCSVSGGQCTKSHVRSWRSLPSTIRTHSPATTRNASCDLSRWYIAIGWPGRSTLMLIPICGKRFLPSKVQNVPSGPPSRQRDSRAFSTNNPSPSGTGPSSSVASSPHPRQQSPNRNRAAQATSRPVRRG